MIRRTALQRAIAYPLAALLLAIPSVVLAAAPYETVHYVEFPEDGPMLDSGRRLVTSGGEFYGIDINSRLEIKVDPEALLASLSNLVESEKSAEIAGLTKRLTLLTEVSQSLARAQQDVVELAELFASNSNEFVGKLRSSASHRFEILSTLQAAQQQRLEQQGISADIAQQVSKQAIAPVLTAGPKMQNGYDWQALGELYAEEINLAAAELAELGSELGVKIEIQAHLVSADGKAVAAYLPNYNQVAIGSNRPFEKLKFAPSAGEKELYEHYRTMAGELKEQQSAGDAFLVLLEEQYEILRQPLAELTGEAKRALAVARGELENLKKWQTQSNRDEWLDSLRSDLESSAQGRRVIQTWDALESTLGEIGDDVEAIKAYADLDSLLGELDPALASNTIQRLFEGMRVGDPRAAAIRVLDSDRWQQHLDRIKDFVEAVDGLQNNLRQVVKKPGSPYADFVAARTALQEFAEEVKRSAGQIKTWLSKLLFGAPLFNSAAKLPIPAGQRQVPVVSGAQLNTAVNLRTMRSMRSIDDTLRVQYSFFREGKELYAGWVDQFALKSFGWRSEVLASLAFAQHDGEDTWKPTAAMNWILSRDAWPESSQRGLRSSHRLKWFSGFGVSALALDAQESQDVELGVAATVAFLNNRMLLGYGVNLQAEENEAFWYLSIRLFTFPGLSDQQANLTAQ